jgi:hypothetical protein
MLGIGVEDVVDAARGLLVNHPTEATHG